MTLYEYFLVSGSALNTTNLKVPFLDIAAQYRALRGEIDGSIARVFASGNYIAGIEGTAFECELATYLGMNEVVGVNSGTDALLLTLKALDVGAGDSVIVPTFTFFATPEAVSLAGARPVFADCGSDSCNVDVHSIAQAWSPDVKAVIVVHLYGRPVDLDPIQKFCLERNLYLIEDCAQALGARYRGQLVGTFGVAGTFSFYPTKNLGACGDAGAITCNDAEICARLRRLRNHGRTSSGRHDEIGGNSRLDEIQAAILRVKLPYLDIWNAMRRKLVLQYRSGLRETRCILPPENTANLEGFHPFVVMHPQRDELRAYLAENGVDTAVYYPMPCHLQKPYCDVEHPLSLPRAEFHAGQVLALPAYPELESAAIDHVTAMVRRFEQR